jgi:hypothetical protein
VGGFADDEIPLLVMLFYLFRDVEASRPWAPDSSVKPFRAAIYAGDNVRWGVWLGRHIC